MKMLRISPYMLLAALLTLVASPCRAQMDDSIAAPYKARFISLQRSLVEKSDDILTLIALSDFYADSLNPVYNRTLAMDYLVKADKLFTDLLKSGRHVRKANRLVSQGVTVDGLRQKRHDIVNSTLAHLQSLPPMTLGEVEHSIRVFKSEPKVLQQLNRMKVVVAYRNAAQQQSPDAYYTFLNQYGGTAEADSAEANLYRWAINAMKQASTNEQVDNIAQRYPKSAFVQQAAKKRKGHIAFQDAYNRHSLEAYRDYLTRYPSSDDYVLALDMLDTLATEDLYLIHNAQGYVDFIQSHSDNPLGEKALQLLRERIVKHHDTEAARAYLTHYPLDIEHSNIYQIYYGWHADEGNLDPIRDFARKNPDYPRKEQLGDDRAQAVDVDEFDLMRPYKSAMEKEYASFLRMHTGKHIAFVTLQRMLQPALDGKRWKAALKLMQEFSLSFEQDNQQEYQELMQLLDTATASKSVADATPRWENTIPHIFDSESEDQVELFCLYDNGETMLVGIDGDIAIARLDNGVWNIDDPLPEPVNTPYWETDAYMLPDGSGLLLASDRPGGCNVQASNSRYHGDTALATDLYFVPCHNGQWGDAIHLDVPVNTPYCERYPVMSRDGNTLYFVSDGRGGMGYGDIYLSSRLDDSWQRWSTPRNLGRETNSAHRESHLAFSQDESMLYFMSDRGGRLRSYSTAVRHQPGQTLRNDITDSCWNLDNIAFQNDSGSTYITHPGILNALVSHLQQNPDIEIEIVSHHQGISNEESYGISLQRGDAVRRHLLRRGIAPSRIRVSAYGNIPEKSDMDLKALLSHSNKQ